MLGAAGGDIAAGAAVIAAGAWSASLARRLGANVPLESERGYHVELVGPSLRPAVPVMNAAQKFVATPMDTGLRLAGLIEFGGLSAPPSDGPLDLLLRGARAMFPGLEFEAVRTWLGHRPATADSLPVIGQSPLCDNVFFAYGHHHVGLTAGPKTGPATGAAGGRTARRAGSRRLPPGPVRLRAEPRLERQHVVKGDLPTEIRQRAKDVFTRNISVTPL